MTKTVKKRLTMAEKAKKEMRTIVERLLKDINEEVERLPEKAKKQLTKVLDRSVSTLKEIKGLSALPEQDITFAKTYDVIKGKMWDERGIYIERHSSYHHKDGYKITIGEGYGVEHSIILSPGKKVKIRIIVTEEVMEDEPDEIKGH